LADTGGPIRHSPAHVWGFSVTDRTDAYAATAVTGGLLTGDGAALLAFEGEERAVNLRLPLGELMSLLSVCVGLTGQRLPNGGDPEHPAIPVADWRIGVTAERAVVLAMGLEAGGSLSFHMEPQQATEFMSALSRALEVANGETPPG
jgi:hypothetical protein